MGKNPDAPGPVDEAKVGTLSEPAAGGGATSTSETIGEEVRERLGEMTPSERRVARTLLETYPTAGLESLPHLAEVAGVTGPTVLRFVRKIADALAHFLGGGAEHAALRAGGRKEGRNAGADREANHAEQKGLLLEAGCEPLAGSPVA